MLTLEELRNAILQYIKRNGCTFKDICEKYGISTVSLRQILTGNYYPTKKVLNKISDIIENYNPFEDYKSFSDAIDLYDNELRSVIFFHILSLIPPDEAKKFLLNLYKNLTEEKRNNIDHYIHVLTRDILSSKSTETLNEILKKNNIM